MALFNRRRRRASLCRLVTPLKSSSRGDEDAASAFFTYAYTTDRVDIVIFSIIVIAMRQRHSALMILRRSECGWIFRDKISRKILQQLDAEKNGQHAKPEEVRRLWSLVFPLLLRWGRWRMGGRHRLVTVSKEKC